MAALIGPPKGQVGRPSRSFTLDQARALLKAAGSQSLVNPHRHFTALNTWQHDVRCHWLVPGNSARQSLCGTLCQPIAAAFECPPMTSRCLKSKDVPVASR